MMFRYGKIVDSGNKSSRSDRFAEMSKQQQLIESKKQEIQAKFEEMKRKAEDDGSSKSDNSSSNSKSHKDAKSSMNSRMQSWKSDDRWRKKPNNTDVSEPAPATSDLFSNDGSFLEKYKRMTGNAKDSPNERRSRFSEQYEENASPLPRTSTDGMSYSLQNMNILPVTSSLNVSSGAQSLYTLTAQSPPSVHTSLPVLSAVPSSAASLQTVSLIQVPASSVILSCPIETTLVSSEPVVHLPVVHSTLAHSSVTVPLQTTVIPAQFQITSSAPSVQAMQINQPSTNVLLVPPECITQSPTMSATLPNTSVPPPALPVPPPQPPSMPPPMFSAAYSMPSRSVNASALPPVHLPPPNYNPTARYAAPPTVLDCKASMKLEKNDFGGERALLTSEADERFTGHVSRQREGNLEDIEAVARVVAEHGDSMEKTLSEAMWSDQKLSFLRDKQSPPYVTFRAMVEKFKREKAGDGNVTSHAHALDENTDCGQPGRKRSSRTVIDDDDSDAEEPEERRRKRRKRRSRWAPEDTKVDIPSPVVINPAVGIAAVGVAAPVSLGGIVPVAPPSQQTKLPGMSGALISQVTRTDPALLQYAMKSFGTLNLSDEDWKKAEDHYKINLLYQDMLKKRQELEKLQAAGKHKYAYDSDEDTEGGTWEHKLRQQEMVATQLWADELTERSKGKHHIGDFLPPDELERFMEKYDALKQGREPDLSDYKEFKLKEDNIGFQMLQKLGWSEGQGLGSDGSGIVNPVNKAPTYTTSHGLGVEKPDDVRGDDDEYDAYRKRMMLAYRFRPNPLNNPRRPYY